jgi:hypothetical protein
VILLDISEKRLTVCVVGAVSAAVGAVDAGGWGSGVVAVVVSAGVALLVGDRD